MTQQQDKPYNSHEHLIQIKGKDGQIKDYLPANWRLHELRVTCPTATIESEIVHMNEEKNFVIVKAIIYDGKTYEESARRASSMKQGLLSALDKVETAAKARAARDFGVSTEFALEAEPEEDLDVPPVPPVNRPSNKSTAKGTLAVVSQHGKASQPELEVLHAIRDYAEELGLIEGLVDWEKLKTDILGQAIHDEHIQPGHIERLRKGLAERKKTVQKAANGK